MKINVTITQYGYFWKSEMNGKELSKKSLFKLLGINQNRGVRLDHILRNNNNENYKVEIWERDCE